MKEYRSTPGHYVALASRHDIDDLAAAYAMTQNFTGALIRYRWNEPNLLLRIETHLDWCAEHGLRLMPMIEDKTFRAEGVEGENPMPSGLENLAVKNKGGGYTALRWHPGVRPVFLSTVQQIYSAFGSHLAFEGLATQETALSLADEELTAHGYTPQAYADTYVDIMNTVDAMQRGTIARPARRVFWEQNYFAHDHDGVALESVIARTGDVLALGGPDCAPLNSSLVELVYPRYPKYKDFRFTFIGMSVWSYRQELPDGKTMTRAALYDFAVRKLYSRIVLWTYGKHFDATVKLIDSWNGDPVT